MYLPVKKLRDTVWAKLGLALAAFCCASGAARAGCGDHVVVLANLSPEQRSMVIRMMIGGCDHAAQRGEASACWQCPVAPLGDSPCRGPYCSNEQTPEGVPVSPTPVRTIDPWSLLAHAVKLQQQTFVGYLLPASSSSPVDRLDTIFHPPRAA